MSSKEKVIEVWQIHTDSDTAEKKFLIESYDEPTVIGMNAEGTILGCGFENGEIVLWDWNTKEIIFKNAETKNFIEGLSFPKKNHVEIIHSDGWFGDPPQRTRFNYRSGKKEIFSYGKYSSGDYDTSKVRLTFDKQDRFYLVSGATPNLSFSLFDYKTKKHLQAFPRPTPSSVTTNASLAFSNTGKYIVQVILHEPVINPIHGWVADSHYETIIWSTEYRLILGRFKGISEILFSNSDQYFITQDENLNLHLYELAKKFTDHSQASSNPSASNYRWLHSFKGNKESLAVIKFSHDDRYVTTGGDSHDIKIWKTQSGQEEITFVNTIDITHFLAYTIEGYYFASPINNFKSFKHVNPQITNLISFKVGEKFYPFEQFDIKYNRPDLVLQKIAPEQKERIQVFNKAFEKRLEKMGFSENNLGNDFNAPELNLFTKNIPSFSKKQKLSFKIEVADSKEKLDRLNVYVNDIPIFGRMGLNLRSLNTQKYNDNIQLLLSNGQNKIQISALNQGGAESLKETVYVTYNGTSSKPDLHIIGIGVTEFADENMNLSFAAKDIKDVLGTFSQEHSQYRQVNNYTLLNHEVNLKNLRAIKQELQQTNIDDHVILYIAGHGLVDDDLDYFLATYDTDFTNPSSKAIPYEEIENLLDGIPARKKLMLMDACFSGEIDKESIDLIKQKNTSDGKRTFRSYGNTPVNKVLGEENAFELMKELFVDLRRGTGAYVISSASGVEFAIEGEEWKNGVFTYAFLKGLQEMKADLNGDGQIFVSELQSYLATEVPRLTDNHQRPTMRVENISNDWRVW